MPGEIRHIAEFLEISVDEQKWTSILQHCRFDYMKEHATKSVPLGGDFWDGGAQTFIHKGTNNRWRDVLQKEESLKYEYRAEQELGQDCAHWLASGTYKTHPN